MEAVKDIVAGSVAGAAGILVTQPLDIIRIRLATQNEAGGHRVRGITHCAKLIMRQHGVNGFFRGMTAPLVANAPINATIFAVERVASRWLSRSGGAADDHLGRIGRHLFAGGLSGLAQVPFAIPSELVKLQLQVDHGKREPYVSSLHCARSIVSEFGLAALFRGGLITVARDSLAFGVYFAAYHEAKRFCLGLEDERRRRRREAEHSSQHVSLQLLPSPTTAHAFAAPGAATVAVAAELPPASAPSPAPAPVVGASMVSLMLSGGVAGAASWLFTYPIDVSKSLVQGLPLSTPKEQRSLRAVLRQNLEREHGSWRFLWRGLSPTLVRGFVCSSVVFPVFEATLALMEAKDETVVESQDELHNHR